MNDILKAIQKHEIKKLDNSIRGSEAFERRVEKETRKTKELLVSGDTSNAFDTKVMTAQNLCELYHIMVEDYTKRPNFTDFSKISRQAIAYWTRVYQASQQTKLTPGQYLQAQFEWFHDRFRTTPDVRQLATPAAIQRAEEHSGSFRRVVAGSIETDIPLSAVFKRCDKQVRDMCRAQQITREDFYRDFVLTGVMAMPLSFLTADPVYGRVCSGD